MALTAGVISLISVTATTASLSATAATLGTGPYTYQWYRSTTSGFTPGGGNIISGATTLTLNDSGLVPSTQYYYKVVATDSAVSPATVEYAQVGAQTAQPAPGINQFAQSTQRGVIDLRYSANVVAVQIDSSETGTLYAGSAVKIVDSSDGAPKVVACSANSDEALGFINYDIKSRSYVAGDRAEISISGNVMYLYATSAIARGVQVSLDVSTVGGVRSAAGHTGDKIVGWAFDKASIGSLIRVYIKTPSFTVV